MSFRRFELFRALISLLPFAPGIFIHDRLDPAFPTYPSTIYQGCIFQFSRRAQKAIESHKSPRVGVEAEVEEDKAEINEN